MKLPTVTPEAEKRAIYLIDSAKRLGIYIRPVKFKDNVLYVQVEQKKFINDKVLSSAELIQRGKDPFKGKLAAGVTLIVSPIFNNADELRSVNADYVKKKLHQYNLKTSHLVKYLDLDKSTISHLVNGDKDFTGPMRAAFYYFFKNYDFKQAVN